MEKGGKPQLIFLKFVKSRHSGGSWSQGKYDCFKTLDSGFCRNDVI